MKLDARSLAYGDRDVCEKGGELIRPNYTRKFSVLGEHKWISTYLRSGC